MDKFILEVPQEARVVGYRQVTKGIFSNRIRCVLIAQDAEDDLVKELVRLCRDYSVSYRFCDSKQELGKVLGLDVACAVVGERKDEAK